MASRVQVIPQISQQSFYDVVRENMEEFGKPPSSLPRAVMCLACKRANT